MNAYKVTFASGGKKYKKYDVTIHAKTWTNARDLFKTIYPDCVITGYHLEEIDLARETPPNVGTSIQRPKIHTGTRHCTVGDTPGTFHRWVVQDRILLEIQTFCKTEDRIRINRDFHNNGIIGPECSAKVIRENFALIEFSDGSVGFIEPRNVRFTDKEVPEE